MSQISAYAVGVGLSLALNTNELQLGFGHVRIHLDKKIGGAVLNAISAGQWYHVVAIKKGSGTLNATTLPDILEIYINGEKKTLSHGGGTGTLNVGTDHWLIIGSIQDTHSTAEEFKGNVSSIKYYDTALTAEEVKTLYDMGRTGSVANPQPLHIAAPLYAPGVSIQTVAENVHDIVTYPSATSRTITPLTINIKPRFTNSKILLHWMINAEIGENNVVVVYRNGIKIGYNTSIADAIWVGLASAIYDINMDSTIENLNISWIDTPGTTENLEYSIVVKSANTSSFPVYLNRTVGSGAAGTTSFERTVSFKSATEIAH